MNTCFCRTVSVLIALLLQSCHSSSIRKTRVATDTEDDEFARKIVPKSIFIAPMFRCPPGHVLSNYGECLLITRISFDGQYAFILSRLNSMLDVNGEVISIRSKKENKEYITKPQPTTNNPYDFDFKPIRSRYAEDGDTDGPVKIGIPYIKEKLKRD